jgi:nitrate/nitrite transporter NarK
VLLASRLPNMVLVLTGGVVADRLSRRRVMLASDAVRCLT